MAIDLINQQVPDSDPKVIIKEAKEAVLDFSQGTVEVFQFYFFCFNIKQLNITL